MPTPCGPMPTPCGPIPTPCDPMRRGFPPGPLVAGGCWWLPRSADSPTTATAHHHQLEQEQKVTQDAENRKGGPRAPGYGGPTRRALFRRAHVMGTPRSPNRPLGGNARVAMPLACLDGKAELVDPPREICVAFECADFLRILMAGCA
jgi:hypothetical protein